MTRKGWLAVVAVVLIVVSTVWGVSRSGAIAQGDGTPIALTASPMAGDGLGLPGGSVAASFLVAPELLGDGWSVVATGFPPANPRYFASSASATYVGPGGGRVSLAVYQNQPGREALQQSWIGVGDVFDTLSRAMFYTSNYYNRSSQLASIPFAPGCVDEVRLDGNEAQFGLPSSITQCAVDPDITLLIQTSGPVAGQSGYLAGDYVASVTAGTAPSR